MIVRAAKGVNPRMCGEPCRTVFGWRTMEQYSQVRGAPCARWSKAGVIRF
jgi:hypothetical protein